MVSIISTLLEKCNIYFDNSLISKESIIERYLSFIANSMNAEKNAIGFALHTGSVCFDAAAVAAICIGCLSYNFSTNDDIISTLEINEMVMYKNSRYRWKGKEKKDGLLYLVLEQDGVGKDGPTKRFLPYEKNKHNIKPYHGQSKKTDGRGVKKFETNREDFLSYLFNIPTSDISSQIDISVVVISERESFANILKNTTIEYDNKKSVNLLDVMPVSYYTSVSKEYPFGSNPTKSEPVIKVSGNLSIARELILNKFGNKVIGLLVFGDKILRGDYSELFDLLRRRTLKIAFLMSSIQTKWENNLFETYEDAQVFACTKDYLSQSQDSIKVINSYTEELHRQINTIVNCDISPIVIEGGISKDTYSNIGKTLLNIKQSELRNDLKDEFVFTALGLLNLFNTSVFRIEQMEKTIEDNQINLSVKSPKYRIDRLWNIAENAGQLQDLCAYVADKLEQKYNEMFTTVPKFDFLCNYLKTHSTCKIAIIVPKSYYRDILNYSEPNLFLNNNVSCVTLNRFDSEVLYDTIFIVGEIYNKKPEWLYRCFSKKVYVLLYSCEKKSFDSHYRKKILYEKELNEKVGIVSKYSNEILNSQFIEEEENEVRLFTSLDEYIGNYDVFDIRKIAIGSGQAGTPFSEVTHVGVFVSGEHILFSKFYSAVVYDDCKNKVVEKKPGDLKSGDILVFTKKNDYTQNIVDIIFNRLLKSGKLNRQYVDALEKSQYWKEALREYRSDNNKTYRDIKNDLNKLGCTIQEVTVRQWLEENSYIIGPQKEKTMEFIAQLTQDPYLLEDTHVYFEACGIIRRKRMEILSLIAKAICNKLSGLIPSKGSIEEIVYNNVEKLSETIQLDDISELNESVNVNINLGNL